MLEDLNAHRRSIREPFYDCVGLLNLETAILFPV